MTGMRFDKLHLAILKPCDYAYVVKANEAINPLFNEWANPKPTPDKKTGKLLFFIFNDLLLGKTPDQAS